MKEIWFVGGGSGGHLIPLLVLMKKMDKSNNTLITTGTKTDLCVIKKTIEDGNENKLSIYNLNFFSQYKMLWIRYCILIFYAVPVAMKIIYLLFKKKPCEIHTTGGYIGFLVGCIALIRGIRSYVYHLDIKPGKAGTLLSFFCNSLMVHEKTREFLPKIFQSGGSIIPYPHRFEEKDKLSKDEALIKLLGKKLEKKIILIFGGSQGSNEITNILFIALKKIKNKNNFYFFHQSGIKESENIQREYKLLNIDAMVFDYHRDMNLFYSASDGVISRAGAGSIAELLFFSCKTLLIPLKNVASNHQITNALEATKKNPDIFFSSISYNEDEIDSDITTFLSRV